MLCLGEGGREVLVNMQHVFIHPCKSKTLHDRVSEQTTSGRGPFDEPPRFPVSADDTGVDQEQLTQN